MAIADPSTTYTFILRMRRKETIGHSRNMCIGYQCDSKIQLQSEQGREEVLIIYSITTIFLTLN